MSEIRDDEVVLEAADPYLTPFYEVVFRCYRRRCSGEGEGPAPQPPAAIQPFLRFKPDKAVRQAKVRGVLRQAIAADASLRDMCRTEMRSGGRCEPGPSPVPADVFALLAQGDERALSLLVSRAAAFRDDGWEIVLWMAAAAGVARERAEQVAKDRALRSEEARRAEEIRRVGKIERARDKALAEKAKARGDAETFREQRDRLRRETRKLVRERDQAMVEAEAGRSRLAGADKDNVTLKAALEEARRRRKEMADAFARERAELQAQIRHLREVRIPDLEGPAEAIEAIAGRLRRAQAAMIRPSEAAEDNRSPTQRGAGPMGRRAVVEHPPGVRPGSRDALRWALREPGFVVLVDAYNVILEARRGWGDLPGPDQRRLLLSRCKAMLPEPGAEIWVVFDSSEPDGTTPARRHPRLHHEFTRGQSADDRLVEIAASLEGEGRPACAVTSDRELQDRLSAHGIASVPSEVFLEVAEAPLR